MNEDNEKRIWGYFTVLYDAGNIKVKELVVKPSLPDIGFTLSVT